MHYIQWSEKKAAKQYRNMERVENSSVDFVGLIVLYSPVNIQAFSGCSRPIYAPHTCLGAWTALNSDHCILLHADNEMIVLKPTLVRKKTTHFVVEPKMGISKDAITNPNTPKKELKSFIPVFWQVEAHESFLSYFAFC